METLIDGELLIISMNEYNFENNNCVNVILTLSPMQRVYEV